MGILGERRPPTLEIVKIYFGKVIAGKIQNIVE